MQHWTSNYVEWVIVRELFNSVATPAMSWYSYLWSLESNHIHFIVSCSFYGLWTLIFFLLAVDVNFVEFPFVWSVFSFKLKANDANSSWFVIAVTNIFLLERVNTQFLFSFFSQNRIFKNCFNETSATLLRKQKRKQIFLANYPMPTTGEMSGYYQKYKSFLKPYLFLE